MAVMQNDGTGSLKIVYIVGWARSGSTLLDNILGAVPGFFSVGELHNLWDDRLNPDRRCGCGRPLRECPIWSVVMTELGPLTGDGEVYDWQQELAQVHHTSKILRQVTSRPAEWRALERYAGVTEALYGSVAKASGSAVIVDSSKRPTYAALLPGLRGVEPYFVHIVRDPRAVAHSWSRPKLEEPITHGAAHSTLRWATWNLAAERLRRAFPGRFVRIRYEDLVTDTRRQLETITKLVGHEEVSLPLTETGVVLAANHSVAGNPNRFKTGEIAIRLDDEWATKLSMGDRAVATAVALPWLSRYGYAVSARGRS